MRRDYSLYVAETLYRFFGYGAFYLDVAPGNGEMTGGSGFCTLRTTHAVIRPKAKTAMSPKTILSISRQLSDINLSPPGNSADARSIGRLQEFQNPAVVIGGEVCPHAHVHHGHLPFAVAVR